MEHRSVSDSTAVPVLADVSVVIPTIGRTLLQGAIESLVAGSSWPAELLIVNQGSEAAVEPWVEAARDRGLQARQVVSLQSGTASATNLGLEQIRTRYVAVTHDDCIVSPDWLRLMAVRMLDSPESIITGRVLGQGHDPVPSTIASLLPKVYDRPLLKRDPLFPANMGFALATARRVGPFDESPVLRTAEDCEWSYRALRSGTRIDYAPDVVVSHVAWRDARARLLTYRSYARSLGGFYGTYIRRGDSFILARLLFDLTRGPWMLARALASGNKELQAIGRAYVSQLLPGTLAGLRRSDRS